MHLAPARPVTLAFAAGRGGLQRQRGGSSCSQSAFGSSRAQRSQLVVSAKKRGSGGSSGGGSRSQQTAAKHRKQQAAAAAQQIQQQQQAAAAGVGANAAAPPPPASLAIGGAPIPLSASQLGGELDLSRIDKLELRGNELVLTLRSPGDPEPAGAEASGSKAEGSQGEDFVDVSPSPSVPRARPPHLCLHLLAVFERTAPVHVSALLTGWRDV